MNPKISVLVITYNQKNFIVETIESVLSQDYPNIEYVIADDGSTDGTAEIIEDYANRYPNIIRAITGKENVGITRNSNRGLKECTGKYIAIQGGDDVFLPGKLRKQVDWLEEDNNRVICGHFLYLCDKSSINYGVYKTQAISGRGPRCWIERGPLYGATSVMIRSESLPSYGFDERMPYVSDWKLYIDSLGADSEFGCLHEFLGKYRKHDNNITNIKPPLMKDVVRTFDIIEEEMPMYRKSVKVGRAYLVDYGTGIHMMENGNYKGACVQFCKSIMSWPLNKKPYLRLLQCVFRSIIN